jgi:hypothetical protein
MTFLIVCTFRMAIDMMPFSARQSAMRSDSTVSMLGKEGMIRRKAERNA